MTNNNFWYIIPNIGMITVLEKYLFYIYKMYFSVKLVQTNNVCWKIQYSKIINNKYIILEVEEMKYVCDICGYIYDEAEGEPDNGIAPGTKWEDLPDDYVCPLCGVGKDQFSKMD